MDTTTNTLRPADLNERIALAYAVTLSQDPGDENHDQYLAHALGNGGGHWGDDDTWTFPLSVGHEDQEHAALVGRAEGTGSTVHDAPTFLVVFEPGEHLAERESVDAWEFGGTEIIQPDGTVYEFDDADDAEAFRLAVCGA